MKSLLKKVTVKILYAGLLSILCLTVINSASAQTYDPYTVEVINRLIDSNGLKATPNAPETWTFATWNDESPKQIIKLMLIYHPSSSIYGSVSLVGLTRLQTLHCYTAGIEELNLTNCVQLDTLYCGENPMTNLDLTNTGPLRAYEAYMFDFVYLYLYGNYEDGYTLPIYLNNPTFFWGDYVSYSDGILKATNDYPYADGTSTPFETETNKAGYKLSGIMLLMFRNNTDTLGINTPEKSLFKVYPNPAGETIFVDYEKSSTIKIYNLQGVEVLSKAGNGKTEVDVSRLPKGIYIVRVFSEGKEVGSTKIIKQ